MDSSHQLVSRQRFSLFSLAVQAYRQGKLGDVAAYKSAILGTKAYPDIAETLSRLKTCCPTIDLTALRTLPEGTFGQIYAQHMDECHLTPLEISADVIASLPDQSLGLRYTLLHDVFHVLLGYDTSLIGEMGVWAFVDAQHYSPSYKTAAWLAHYLYPLVIPHRYRQLRAIEQHSRKLGQQAACIIAQPLEDYWSEPLSTVRSRLGLA
ncbi:Coq4 family protein [Acaryochloris sp. CCMEE 5410]|uniref:Coq4 family protein n=1 Tax=Acaryochloris sp. CCMEE 5410 TaxID=310037 RepID=UPI0002484433|nr:Coq4 family protein [Acaryochloris sp. CCMEE 5410]KAI9131752.1 hypothetical protein ON05_029735 [Acaryochloris sp. CCMEE 5410]